MKYEKWLTPDYKVVVKLADDCKNGHQDFSITGIEWEKGKAHIDRNMIHCGACGDDIAEKFPEFEIFNNLHLCDYNGVPMYPVSNGRFNIKRMKKEDFCSYYRIPEEHYGILKDCVNEREYLYYLYELGIVDSWKAEALEAIKILEEWTGEKFVNTSTRSQLDEKIDMTGFDITQYTPENKALWRKKEIEEEHSKILEDRLVDIEKIVEFHVQKNNCVRYVLSVFAAFGIAKPYWYESNGEITLYSDWAFGSYMGKERVNEIIEYMKNDEANTFITKYIVKER